MMKYYFQIIKPGIIMGNVITTLAGYFLASRGQIQLETLSATIIGISLVIASACTFNNLFDQEIDKKMSRTKNRALVIGAISPLNATVYALILSIIGFLILLLLVNITTLFVSFMGFFLYVIVYGHSKRVTDWSTVIGSIPGAIPPVVGYVAITDRIDLGAIILFLMLVFWQMPHFYSIAIYRIKEYQSAKLPVLPAIKGIFMTKIHIFLYTIGFALITGILYTTGFVGRFYFISMLFLSIVWIVYAGLGFFKENSFQWAKNMFKLSLIIIICLCTLITLNHFYYN